MLYIFTQANASRMWADWNAEFNSHKENRQNLIYPTYTTGIDLAKPYGVSLKDVFEDEVILSVITSGNTNLHDRKRNSCMSKNIIKTGEFFNPERVKSH